MKVYNPLNHILSDENIILRPLTEADWDTLYHWNNDPAIGLALSCLPNTTPRLRRACYRTSITKSP